jgi:hypothetical protein
MFDVSSCAAKIPFARCGNITLPFLPLLCSSICDAKHVAASAPLCAPLSLMRFLYRRACFPLENICKSGQVCLDKAPEQPWSTAMLAEIFMLQLEAAARSAKEAEPATSARFVPITLPATKASPSGGLIAIVSARPPMVDCSSLTCTGGWSLRAKTIQVDRGMRSGQGARRRSHRSPRSRRPECTRLRRKKPARQSSLAVAVPSL